MGMIVGRTAVSRVVMAGWGSAVGVIKWTGEGVELCMAVGEGDGGVVQAVNRVTAVKIAETSRNRPDCRRPLL